MTDSKTKISNTLFNNRQLFLRYNQFRIHRILETLSATDRLIFTLIPRLLHINQKGLLGYVPGDTPCGVFNFKINQECQMATERLFPKVIMRGGENLRSQFQTGAWEKPDHRKRHSSSGAQAVQLLPKNTQQGGKPVCTGRRRNQRKGTHIPAAPDQSHRQRHLVSHSRQNPGFA